MTISRRAYAKQRGVTEGAVRKAIAEGRVSVEPDGTIDQVKADAHWNDGIVPPVPGGSGFGGAVRKKQTAAQSANKRAVPREAVEAVEETLRAEGQEVPAQPGGMTFIQARTANEILKAQERKLKLDKMRGELVDRARATALVFNLGRQERDAWMNWPVRVAALIAAETNADVHAVQNSLDKYVRQQLAEMAGVDLQL